MSSEKSSRQTVIDNFRELGAHCVRIEDSLAAGVPDLNLSWQGQDCWVEFKYIKQLPKRPGTLVDIGLRVEQKIWLEKRAAAGGNVAIIIMAEPRTWILFHNEGYDCDWSITPKNISFWNMPRYLEAGMLWRDIQLQANMTWMGNFKDRAQSVLVNITAGNRGEIR